MGGGEQTGLLKIQFDSLPVGGAFETISPETAVNNAALRSWTLLYQINLKINQNFSEDTLFLSAIGYI